MAQTYRGWDQIYMLESRNIKKPEDRIILLAHWSLIMHKSFKCCGLGNEKYTTTVDKELSSELLPYGWNFSNQYNIRYICNDSLFILIGTKISNDLLIIYLLQPDSEVLSSITLKISDVIIPLPKNSKIPNIFNNCDTLLEALQKDLIDMALKNSGKLKRQNLEIGHRKEITRKRNTITPHPYWLLPEHYNNINRDDDVDNWEEVPLPPWLRVE